MDKQIILAIGREFGSGGREIASLLSKHFDLPVYDKSILSNIASAKHVNPETLYRYDEKPRNFLTSRHVHGFSSSLEENIAQMEFQYLRQKAESGESFIVLGRCGEEVLKDYRGLISIFVRSTIGFKKKRTMDRDNTSEADALELMSKMDRQRKYYHNQYCHGKWGDSRNYDVCIDSSRLGISGTAEILEQYIQARISNL